MGWLIAGAWLIWGLATDFFFGDWLTIIRKLNLSELTDVIIYSHVLRHSIALTFNGLKQIWLPINQVIADRGMVKDE